MDYDTHFPQSLGGVSPFSLVARISAPLLALPMAWPHHRIAVPILRNSLDQPTTPAFTSRDGTVQSLPFIPAQAEPTPVTDIPSKPDARHALSNKLTLSINLWWAIWFFGAAFITGRVLVSRARVRRLGGTGCLPASEQLILRLNKTKLLLGFTNPTRLMITPRVEIPFCLGLVHPIIILPQSWQEWDEERVDVCLIHEAPHIFRGDLWAMLTGQLTCILCWFNPLVWLATNKLRDEAENAVDDLVLSRNISPELYAATLVNIVDKYQASDLPLSMALPMACVNRLEARVNSILDSTLHRKSPSLTVRLTLALLAMGALIVAMSVQLTADTIAVAPLNTFKAFVLNRQSELSKLSTFKMEGTLKIISSDEYLKEQNSGEAAGFANCNTVKPI